MKSRTASLTASGFATPVLALTGYAWLDALPLLALACAAVSGFAAAMFLVVWWAR